MPTEFHPLNLFWNSRYLFLNIAKDCLLKRFSHINPSLISWWISMAISRIQSKWQLKEKFLCSQFACTPLISLLFFMLNYVTIGKDSDAGKEWRQEEKGTTEDEMVGWHHQLDGHEFEQAPAVDWQGSLASCGPRGATSRTQLSNQTELFMTSQNLFKTCHVNLFTI